MQATKPEEMRKQYSTFLSSIASKRGNQSEAGDRKILGGRFSPRTALQRNYAFYYPFLIHSIIV